ncbi:MAG: hypothetical protein JO255_15965 [Alphaproteobacteria bacterium]|nr:hypothetical protein [Alphaproteobacteria bacterium]
MVLDSGRAARAAVGNMAEKLLENGGATNSNGPILVQDRVANSPANPAEKA